MSMSSVINCEDILKSPVPLVVKGILDWPQLNWNLEDWKNNLHEPDKKYPFRKGKFECSERPQWERNCQVVNLTMEEFFKLVEENINGNESDRKENWYYFDYKHLEQWFNHNISLQEVSWSCLGLDDVPSPTIWIGSKGAHTPCHFDTYGHNLIAQLYGKKMWLLFPPDAVDKLKPCRVPYEESSVYSNINFACGCAKLPELSEVHYVVLEPGDVLYVPKNWWHYVENITTAISINTWLPKKCDNISRIEESLAKSFIISCLKDMSQTERDTILNPNEDDLPSVLNLEELTYCWKTSLEEDLTPLTQINCKQVLTSCVIKVNKIKSSEFYDNRREKCLKNSETTAQRRSSSDAIRTEHLINAFCHPEVLSLVRKKMKILLENFQ